MATFSTIVFIQASWQDWNATINWPDYFRAFPDLLVTVNDQVTEGDKIVTRWPAGGTHHGELGGWIPPVPHLVGLHRFTPTGKEVIITGVAVDHISGGKITEHFGLPHSLGMMQQMGVLPTTN